MKRLLAKHWSYIPTGSVLAVLLIVFWFLNQSYLAPSKGMVASLLENPIPTFGLIIFGAHNGAFISGEFSIKAPLTFEPLVLALAGGFIIGVGAVIAKMSIHSVVLFNLPGVFTLPAFMMTKGWIFIAFMVLGGFLASRLLLFFILKTRHLKREIPIPAILSSKRNQHIAFYMLLAVFAISMLIIIFQAQLIYAERTGLILAMLLLALFGFIVERGTICMSSMLKEWFISHSAYVWRSILFTVMCLALLYQAGLQLSLYEPIVLEEFVSNPGLLVLGSFLMGFGFIFADGCFIGSLWKAGQGNVINIVGIIGLLAGIGASELIKDMFITETGSSTGFITNDLSSIMSPLLFLIVLWIIGILLMVIFKQKHYRY